MLLGADPIFWEDPEVMVSAGVKFIQAVSDNKLAFVAWQDYEEVTPDEGQVYLSGLISKDGINWRRLNRFIGPWPYRGKKIQLFSMAIARNSQIYLALTTGEKTVGIFTLDEKLENFYPLAELKAGQIVVFPRLSISAKGELLLFISFLFADELGIYFSHSSDGKNWSPLTSMGEDDKELSQKSLPFHTVFKGKDFLAFQAKRVNTDFQIFLLQSGDGGKNWSKPISITDFAEMQAPEPIPANRMANQRPSLITFGQELFLSWERNSLGRAPQVYVMALDINGKITRPPQKVSEGTGNCYNPQLFTSSNNLYLFWFDDTRGGQDNIFFTSFNEGIWQKPIMLSRSKGNSRFPRPVFLNSRLFVFWENELEARERLVLLKPDITVHSPSLKPLNFTDKGYGRLEILKFSWNVPEDSSGIDRFYYLLSKMPPQNPLNAKEVLVDVTQAQLEIPADGTWYLAVFAKDYAGNISAPALLSYTRDSTPPGRVSFLEPEKDSEGFLLSNSPTLRWQPPAQETVAGYVYKILPIWQGSENSVRLELVSQRLPNLVLLTQPELKLNNLDNGTWLLAVAAIDQAGNVGESEILEFRLRNYQPVTYITSINISPASDNQNYELRIIGRGFAEGGLVDQVILDQDGMPPYDHVLSRTKGEFVVENDRLVSGIILTDISEGSYRVLVRHPQRGLAQNPQAIFNQKIQGAVKYGEFDFNPQAHLTSLWRLAAKFSLTDILLWVLFIFLALLILLTMRKLVSVVGEAFALRREVSILLEGGDLLMPVKTEKIMQIKKKGIGLRLKFTLLISVLVVSIVVMVALPISIFMIQTQEKVLATKLYEKVNIVLRGVAEQARTYLFDKNTLALNETLQKQYSLLGSDARFAYITGPIFRNPRTGSLDLTATAELDTSSFEHIWAYLDPDLKQKIDTEGFEPIVSRLKDEVSPLLTELAQKINTEASLKLTELNKRLDEITDQYNLYLLRTDEKALAIKEQLRQELQLLNKQRDTILESIGGYTGSLPEFNYESPQLEQEIYVFYKPIVNRLRILPDNYYWGAVRVGISTLGIREEIRQSRELLLIEIAIIALIALGLGLVGALVMASITLIPIRTLAQGVAVIRDTQDKALLKDHIIRIKSRDEIGALAETINQMTQGLVKAALANKELIIGKEVQKMFIPLEQDATGKKLSTGRVSNAWVDIFGYYEGAKGVSGDYFDFKQLDDRYFAIIKCDVAGKGVSAALIMVEVATIFLTYFREWSLAKEGRRIDRLVYRINDMLEERGFRGRFAALTLCLFDSQTGICSICNAGDNLVQVYKKQNKCVETIKLNNAPAAGVFPSSLVELQSGFKVMDYKLEQGDVLFLFTDGVDEAKRLLRAPDFSPTLCDEPDLEAGQSHGGTHAKGANTEDFGLSRFKEIVEAVFNKGTYRLKKYHDPLPEEDFVFDYSSCTAGVEAAILAVIAAEKLFRLVPNPAASVEDIVKLDKRLEEFLKKHWPNFARYFKERFESNEEPAYAFYRYLIEDEQYDDLTIVGVQKK